MPCQEGQSDPIGFDVFFPQRNVRISFSAQYALWRTNFTLPRQLFYSGVLLSDDGQKAYIHSSETSGTDTYTWDLATNTFSQRIRLSAGLGEAYTPTAIGADGAVYAVSNARLYSVGR